MEAKILDRPPLSGDFEEHSFVESGNNTVWVKFLDSEYLEWVAVFSLGEWASSIDVLKLEKQGLFLVVAGGQGYFVDPNARKVVEKTEWAMIQAIIYNKETDSFVATDGLCLAVINGVKTVWSSRRVSADGISFNKQVGSVVYGQLNDLTDGGCEYSFSVETKEFKSDWDCFL